MLLPPWLLLLLRQGLALFSRLIQNLWAMFSLPLLSKQGRWEVLRPDKRKLWGNRRAPSPPTLLPAFFSYQG